MVYINVVSVTTDNHRVNQSWHNSLGVGTRRTAPRVHCKSILCSRRPADLHYVRLRACVQKRVLWSDALKDDESAAVARS